jgi:hypothetical protein
MVSRSTYPTAGTQMTLYEGIIIVNLIITAFLAYKYGQLKSEIEVLYEGVAMTMAHTGMTQAEED